MRKNKRIDVIVIDADPERRMKLKSAASDIPQFGKVRLSSSPSAALKILEENLPMVVVFLSSALEPKSVSDFVQLAKKTRSGIDSAYLLVLRPEDQGSSQVSLGLMKGLDGFLLEPFSVDSLRETTTLAQSVYKQRKRAREEAALELLAKDVLNRLDDVAFCKLTDQPLGTALRELRSLKESVQSLEEGTQSLWYSVIGALCDKAFPFQPRTKEDNAELSTLQRLKKQIEEEEAAQKEAKKPSSSGFRVIRG